MQAYDCSGPPWLNCGEILTVYLYNLNTHAEGLPQRNMLIQLTASLLLSAISRVAAQTVYTAGDSTMAAGGGGAGTDGTCHLG